MRRLIALGVLCALLGLAAPAPAQQNLNVYPQGIAAILASATVANTTTATNLFSTTIPRLYMGNHFQPLVGAASLVVRSVGQLTTNASSGGVGTINIGCNYGGSTATITLVNAVALTANMTNQPFALDLLVRQVGGGSNQWVQGTFTIETAAGSATSYRAAVLGTTNMGAAQTLQCIAQWASASTTNSVSVESSVLGIGP